MGLVPKKLFCILHQSFDGATGSTPRAPFLRRQETGSIIGITLILGMLILGCQPYHTPSSYRMPSPPAFESVSFKDTLQNRGHYYTVQKGDSVYTIARQYNADPHQIMRINKIDRSGMITAGQSLFIPGSGISSGVLPVPLRVPSGRSRSLSFSTPMEGPRRVKNNEMIIRASGDTVVSAAEGGLVTFNDTLRGYGSTVIIEHVQGLSTVYANLAKSYVAPHQRVQKGERIGEVSHAENNNTLRFQIRKGTHVLDPRNYVK